MKEPSLYSVGQTVYFNEERKTVEEVEWWKSSNGNYYHMKEDPPTVWIPEHLLQASRLDPPMVDISNPDRVEITVDADGKTVWVNVGGVCRLRACKISSLAIADHREENPSGKRETKTPVLRSKGPGIVKTRVRS